MQKKSEYLIMQMVVLLGELSAKDLKTPNNNLEYKQDGETIPRPLALNSNQIVF